MCIRDRMKEGRTFKQCMDADNLHRRLRKIIGQVQAIDRMVEEGYLPPFINFNPLPTQYPAHAAEKLPSHGNP